MIQVPDASLNFYQALLGANRCLTVTAASKVCIWVAPICKKSSFNSLQIRPVYMTKRHQIMLDKRYLRYDGVKDMLRKINYQPNVSFMRKRIGEESHET